MRKIGLLVSVCVIGLLAGCITLPPNWSPKWPPSFPSWPTNGVPPVVNPPATNTPPVTPPPATGLVPVKIAHGELEDLKLPKKGDCDINIGRIQFRCFEIKLDSAICDEVMATKAVRVKDGMAVADDFVNSKGQVMVWQYWTLGTSSITKKSTENPVKAPNDTRVWYRCCAPTKATMKQFGIK